MNEDIYSPYKWGDFPSEAARKAYIKAKLRLNQIVILDGLDGTQGGHGQFNALDRLPSLIKGLPFWGTLSFQRTQISDISPLIKVYELKNLLIDFSAVSDLKPILQMHGLTKISFKGTTAARHEPLKSISELKDGTERLQKLRAYLLEQEDEMDDPLPQAEPSISSLAKHEVKQKKIETELLSLETRFLEDPIKLAIREQLLDHLGEIKSKGNRFPELFRAAKCYEAALMADGGVIYALNVYTEARIFLDAKDHNGEIRDEPELFHAITRLNILGSSYFGDDPIVRDANENFRQYNLVTAQGDMSELAGAMLKLNESIIANQTFNAETTRQVFSYIQDVSKSNIEAINAQKRATIYDYLKAATAFAAGGFLSQSGQDLYFLVINNWDGIVLLSQSYGAEGLQWARDIYDYISTEKRYRDLIKDIQRP